MSGERIIEGLQAAVAMSSDAGDLVKRLETLGAQYRDGHPGFCVTKEPTGPLLLKAAASIAALSEENERLKAALGEVVNPDITKAGK